MLHLVPWFSRTNDLIHDYIAHLDSKRFASHLCYLGERDTGVEETLCPVHFMGRSRKKLRSFSPSLLHDLKTLMDEEQVDFVHCHRHKAALYGTLVAQRCRRRVPVVVTVHGMGRTRTLLRRLTNRYLFARITKVLAVSQAVRTDLLRSNPGLDPSKVFVIHNGIDLSRFPLRRKDLHSRGRPVFGTVGRLVPTKGQDLLLQAFAGVLTSLPDATLRIAGAGPLESSLMAEAEKLGIGNRVVFTGFISDVANFLVDLDFFVLPSRAEGLPLVLLEAMAVGVPVIASDAGGIPEVLSDPACGCLVPGGSVESLEQAMVEAAAFTQERYGTMVTAARRRIEDAFSLDRMARDVEKVYEECLSL